MKFSCERCGKKYATAAQPAPGKVYKLPCKACGHLIVVRATASGAGPAAAPVEAVGAAVAPSAPAPSPDSPVGLDAAGGAPSNGAAAAGAQLPADFTPEVSTAPPGEEPPAPLGEPGFVDLFSDLEGPGAAGPDGEPEDPLHAAARASLPEGYGAAGGAPDPLASLRQEPAGAVPPPLPKVPDIPRPPAAQKSNLALVLIGLGVVVLIGILAFVLLGSGDTAPPMPPPPAQVQPAR